MPDASSSSEILRYAAFAASPDGGNPAGVVLDASGLDDTEMLRIAADLGYPETAFVHGGDAAARRFPLRYWSPGAEVPFCGHATVATAVALAERIGPGEMVFETRAGEIALTATGSGDALTVSFTSVPPEVREIDPTLRARLLDVLGLVPDDLDPRFPAREAFAGNWHPVLVLTDRELFHQFRFSPAELAALMAETDWTGTVTVLHAQGERDYLARNLFPVGRITEDPATGSAAASTGAYLREVGRAQAGDVLRIHQGAHVGRPSLLTVTVPAAGGIVVSGGATRLP